MAFLEGSYEGGIGVTFPDQQAQRLFISLAGAARPGKRQNSQKYGARSHCPSRLLCLRLVDQPSANNRGDNFCSRNLMRIDIENILRHNNQVSELTGLKRTFRFFAPAGKRCTECVATNDLSHRQSLLGDKSPFGLTLDGLTSHSGL